MPLRWPGFVLQFLLDAPEAGAQLEIVRGLTYGQMDGWIDQLAEEMERLHVRGATSSLTALLRNSITPAPAQQHVEPLITPAYTPAAPQPTQAFQLNVEASYAAPHHGLQFSEEAFRGLDFGYQPEPLYYSAPVTSGVAPVVPVGVAAVPSSLPVAPALDDVIPAPETAFESTPEDAAQSIAAESSDNVPTDVAVVGEEGAVGGRGGGRTRRPARGRGGRGEDGERRERIQRDRKPRRDVAPKAEEGKEGDAFAAAPVEGEVKHRPEGGRGRGGRGKPFRERAPRQSAVVEAGAPVEVASSSSAAPVAVEEAAPAPATVKETKRWDREFKRKHEEPKAAVPVEEKKEVKEVVTPVEVATPSVPEPVAAAPVAEVKPVVEAVPAPTPAPAPKVEPKKFSWKEVGRALATPAESTETVSSPATSAPEKAAVAAESAEQSGDAKTGPKGPRRDRKPRPPFNGEKGEFKERGDRPFREHRHPRAEGEGKEGEHKPFHHRGPRPVKAGEKTVNSDGAVSRPHPPRPAPVAAAK
eukprot:gene9991-11049_t